jgi:polysaccharide pyruvyl transferase WcaK-like protein
MTRCAVAENGIAMRYHAALAMLRAGTNLKLVPYDTKVEELKKAIVNKQNYIATNEKRFEQMREAFKKEFVC